MTLAIGIPSTRVSDLFVQQRLLQQSQYDEMSIFQLQTQMSTGYRFQVPSEDPVAAMQVASLQSLMERKAQVKTNISTNQAFLSSTEVAMSSVSGLLADVRAATLGVADSTSTDTQRQAAVAQINETIRQMVNLGNQKLRGRYLFAGSETSVSPFSMQGDSVAYSGNDSNLQSYADLDLLFDTNITGDQVFGAISDAVQGTANLQPVTTSDTRLSDLRGGKGIDLGSIMISDGRTNSVVDLSSAETLGDVATLIAAHPPANQAVQVEVTTTGLRLRLDPAGIGGNLSVHEVGGGRTASELGIANDRGVGNDWLTGSDLKPVLRLTTPLDDIPGTRSQAVIRFNGPDNDIILEADEVGDAHNGVGIAFHASADVVAGHERVSYDGLNIVVDVQDGRSTVANVVAAINQAHSAGTLPFVARLDLTDNSQGGNGLIPVTPVGETVGTTSGGSGEPLDRSGLQILNGGQAYTIDMANVRTIQDLLNALNGSQAGVLAKLNASGTGIDVRSRLSGDDFAIGENGGHTARQLGLRTFNEASLLSGLNHGLGVNQNQTSPEAVDFTITRSDGVRLDVDISGCDTIGKVLDRINTNAANLPLDADGNPPLEARLAAYGNGIELVDRSGGSGTLSVVNAPLSTTATDLGLVAREPVRVQTTLSFDGANNDLVLRSKLSDAAAAGWKVEIQDATPGDESFQFDSVNKVLRFEVEDGVTTANRMVELFNADAGAKDSFTLDLNPSDGHPNDGTGTVTADGAGPTALPLVFSGSDTNPTETKGLFTSLLRIKQGLERNNLAEVQRGMEMLDDGMLNLNLSRAEVGASEQSLEAMTTRLDDENTELKKILSDQWDSDFVDVVTQLTARQAALQASLAATGQLSRLSLLNYL